MLNKELIVNLYFSCAFFFFDFFTLQHKIIFFSIHLPLDILVFNFLN